MQTLIRFHPFHRSQTCQQENPFPCKIWFLEILSRPNLLKDNTLGDSRQKQNEDLFVTLQQTAINLIILTFCLFSTTGKSCNFLFETPKCNLIIKDKTLSKCTGTQILSSIPLLQHIFISIRIEWWAQYTGERSNIFDFSQQMWTKSSEVKIVSSNIHSPCLGFLLSKQHKRFDEWKSSCDGQCVDLEAVISH